MDRVNSDEKVIAFPASRIVRRGPADPASADFLQKVLPLMKNVTGLDYLKVKETLHGKDKGFMEFIRDAVDRGSSPEEFVRFTIETNGLMSASMDVSVDEAEYFNYTKLAILDFADEVPGWERCNNGSVGSLVYAEDGSVVARAMMNPIKHAKTGEYGFAVRIYDRDFDQPDSDQIAFKSTPVEKFAGFDLEDPVNELEAYRAKFQSRVAYIR
jgi:hypothetical protein